jgi:hypothetical protein
VFITPHSSSLALLSPLPSSLPSSMLSYTIAGKLLFLIAFVDGLLLPIAGLYHFGQHLPITGGYWVWILDVLSLSLVAAALCFPVMLLLFAHPGRVRDYLVFYMPWASVTMTLSCIFIEVRYYLPYPYTAYGDWLHIEGLWGSHGIVSLFFGFWCLSTPGDCFKLYKVEESETQREDHTVEGPMKIDLPIFPPSSEEVYHIME